MVNNYTFFFFTPTIKHRFLIDALFYLGVQVLGSVASEVLGACQAGGTLLLFPCKGRTAWCMGQGYSCCPPCPDDKSKLPSVLIKARGLCGAMLHFAAPPGCYS